MLACVVDCPQICRARSTSRRTGCEGKLWFAEREYDQDVLIRAFSSSIEYLEASCTARSESRRCLDGSNEQPDCINAGKENHESEDEGAENDAGSEEHPQEDQAGEEKHARGPNTDKVRKLGEEAEVEDTSNCRVSTSDHTTRMPAKSTERLQSSSRGTHLESVERALGRRTEAVSTELGHSLSVRFGEGAQSVGHINSSGERGKEPQLAEGRSRSHEFFGERLGVVGSRDERSGVQLGLSSSWGDDLRGSQEHVSFHGEDTVERNTNVGEEDDFGFDVEEFQTPHGRQKHDELIQETESLSEFQTRGDNSRGRDRQSSPSATYESTQAPHETTLRTTAGSRLRSSPKESDDSHLTVEATTGGRKIPERLEAGAGRVGKGHENDLGGEGHLRKSEASLTPYERRVRPRLDGPAAGGRGEETEEASTKIVRPSRPSGGKDRHSKVNTAKGPRDRRVRLSVPTAVQFYDVQDRLGYDQPSKAVEWLIKKAKAAIDELGRLPARGDGPSTLSDITHGSPYPPSLRGPVSGSSSCPPASSFSAALSSPFGDHVGNQLSYFLDSSTSQGVPFGNHPVHTRDVVGGIGLSQAHLVAGQGQLAGLSFPLGQTDLSRGSPGCVDVGKPGEFTGRVESRSKARERARERVKEKCTGRDCGKGTGDGSSTSSLQSPPLHQNPIHGAFPVQNAMQSSVRSLSLQNQHPSPLQSSLPSVFDTTLSGILQSSQQGTLQNLIMQNPSLQSPLADQVQSSLQHPFQASFESTLQLTSQSMSSLPNPGMQQQPHLQRSSLEGSTQRALHLGSGFTPGPCSSSFSEAASLSSSDFMSISSIPISHSLSISELSSFGITSPSSIGPHRPKGNSAVQIPRGFSPGPPALAFRPRPTAISQSCSESQPQGQLVVPPYSAAHVLASPGGSTSSKASTSLYYAPTSSRTGSHQSISPGQLESNSFSSVRSVGYDYQILQMMSPGRASGSYQTSSSQLQLPARIQGLDEFDEELKSSAPSSPHVHP